jgi:predicted short-subunit dehydrogenase-like oxidoreductase (DUF2520 family)
MISVIVLGTGNVGTHLITTFLKTNKVTLLQVYSRKKQSLIPFEKNVDTTDCIQHLKEADVYIIAIADDAIADFSSQLKFKDKLVVHTSGSASINALKNNGHKGVFYPLQTFSKKQPVDFKNIPICLETERKGDMLLLKKLANSISERVYTIDSHQRKRLHVAAVFSNNFVNFMYKLANDICDEYHIPFEILQPLILETAQKISTHHPVAIQTGPARRNDTKTINAHLQLLSGQPKEIYQLITQSILKTYGKKL